jgi:hypothetical protein
MSDSDESDAGSDYNQFIDDSSSGEESYGSRSSGRSGIRHHEPIRAAPITSSVPSRGASPQEISQKRDYLIKLHGLKSRGVELTGNYDMESSLDELAMEYERHIRSAKVKNSMAFSKRALLLAVQGIEMLANVDPLGLGVDLDGWSDTVNPDEYEDILQELVEKYSGDSNTPPELRLIFALTTSAAAVGVSNKMYGKKKKNVSRKLSSLSAGSIREPDFTAVRQMLSKANPTPAAPQVTASVEEIEDDPPSIPHRMNKAMIYDSDSDSGESSEEEVADESSSSGASSSDEEEFVPEDTGRIKISDIPISKVKKASVGNRKGRKIVTL